MAIHDYSIANQSHAAFRSDLNNVLSAIKSSNSDSTEPTLSLLVGQLYYDTSNNKLQVYNGTSFNDVALDSGGNITVTGTLVESSSIQYKTSILPLGSQLDKVLQLNPVSYVKKETGVSEIGFIAEEMAELFPLATSEGAKGVHYSRLTAVLVSAVQELKQQLDDQALEIKELKKG